MALKIRRGTESQRTQVTFASGELIWTTNGQKLYVGDGITPGGIDIASQLGGVGVTYNGTSGKLDLNLGSSNADSLPEGATNRYFTTTRAVAAVSTALTNGNPYNTGITFLYDDVHNRITATVTAGANLPSQTGHSGQFLTTDGSGGLSWGTPAEGITAVSQDSNPQLGGNLVLNTHSITGNGGINITGNINNTGNISNNGAILGGSGLPTQTFERSAYPIYFGSNAVPGTLWVKTDSNGMIIDGLTDGTSHSGILGKISRGTLASRTTLQPGDATMFVEGWGYDGTDYRFTGAVITAADPDGTISGGHIPGAVGLIVSDAGGNPLTATFNSKGVFNAPVIKATSYATSSLPSSPEKGWIVFDSTSNQFKGWNGTAWTVLG